ncbi:hypothetical protein GJT99_02220 (plasmid) [Enterobacteriaceae endosymbiont of Donacia cincticornis]|uniref:prephenate dehydratase domain-containing protein n=1 Tax=Enterobacteriaceae endosymbiont of Donacia cincticornis TaxID=2675773 RepID=UPI001448F91B|nr:prephenate dehydratase domain-containing protein [Enterobacteriaceae endosymbiont of Donacia cincticornis]QJC36319.1 hypothetical protein GJT99_02220 [Enterobacteriaceae endosymbiont of Donacia cincticornis]
MINIIKKNIGDNIIINYNINNIKNNFLTLNINTESIVFLGPLYSYSHLAVLTYINNFFLKKKIINVSCQTFSEIFFYIKQHFIKLAIVPIYNNTTGIIKEVFKLLKINSTYLQIKNIFQLPIKHCLVSKKKTILKKIKKVYSHSEPLKQCSFFIKKNLSWELKHCSSTSYAMNLIQNSPSEKVAAIGNEIAATFYKLYVLKKNISNKKNNKTIFLVLKKN